MYDDTAPDAEAFPFDLERIDLRDPFTPEQGVLAADNGERYCSCGRPLAHARMNRETRSTLCACGRELEEEA